MTVFIQCPRCAIRYEVTPQHIGRVVLCSSLKCRTQFVAAAVSRECEQFSVPSSAHEFVFDGGTMTDDDLPGATALGLDRDDFFDVHDVGQQPFAAGIG